VSRRPPMAHRWTDDLPPEPRWPRARAVAETLAEALVLALAIGLIYAALCVLGPAVAP